MLVFTSAVATHFQESLMRKEQLSEIAGLRRSVHSVSWKLSVTWGRRPVAESPRQVLGNAVADLLWWLWASVCLHLKWWS